MGARLSFGIGPLRISIPLTGGRRRRRRAAPRATVASVVADIDRATDYVQEKRARRRAETTPREGVTPSRVIHTRKGTLYFYDN